MPAKFLPVSFGIFEYHTITFLSHNDVVLLSFSLLLHFLARLFPLIILCRTKSYQLYWLKQLTCLAFLVPCKVYTNLELLNTLWHSLSPLCCITSTAVEELKITLYSFPYSEKELLEQNLNYCIYIWKLYALACKPDQNVDHFWNGPISSFSQWTFSLDEFLVANWALATHLGSFLRM